MGMPACARRTAALPLVSVVHVETMLHELLELALFLRGLPSTPLRRELEARVHAYEAAVNAWRFRPPTNEQLQTMVDCIEDLRARAGFRGPSSAPEPSQRASAPTHRSSKPSGARVPTKPPPTSEGKTKARKARKG
jgi:hypothetical protein